MSIISAINNKRADFDNLSFEIAHQSEAKYTKYDAEANLETIPINVFLNKVENNNAGAPVTPIKNTILIQKDSNRDGLRAMAALSATKYLTTDKIAAYQKVLGGKISRVQLLQLCPNLETLDLSSSTISDRELAEMAKLELPRLTTLRLSACNYLIKPSFKNFSALQFLYLNGFQLIKAEIQDLPKVQIIEIFNCTLLIRVTLKNIPCLHTLKITHCPTLTEFELRDLPAKALSLEKCTALSDLNLQNLACLEAICLNKCRSLTNFIMTLDGTIFTKFYPVKFIDLRDCRKLTNLDLRELHYLTHLYLNGCMSLRDLKINRISALVKLEINHCFSLEKIDVS